MKALHSLFLVFCCPSLSQAWCSSRSVGGVGALASTFHDRASKQHGKYSKSASATEQPQNRRCNQNTILNRFSSRQENDRVTLWSAANDESNGATNGVNDNKGDNNNNGKDSANGGMTLEKASQLLSNFWSMASPYYQESQPGRRLFYGMILLTLVNSGVSVAFSYVSKDFWNALSSKDVAEFYVMMTKFGGALVVGAPVSVLYRYQREQLAVHWREWMTDRTLQLYNSNRVYYALERDVSSSGNSVDANENRDETFAATRIDNPDQRITEDVRTFTAFSLQLFITIVTSIIDLVSFSLILYSIQPQLFATIIAYALFGTVTTTVIGSALLPLNFKKLKMEADLRYLLVRIRENAESIAFYGGEDVEGKEVSSRLTRVVENRREINAAQRNLEFFTNAYQYFIQIVPVAVVAPQYFAGAIQLGVISQSVGAFNHILSDLTVIVNQFEQLSSFSAGIERLSTFMNAMRDADPARSNEDGLLTLPVVSNVTDGQEIFDKNDAESLHQSPTSTIGLTQELTHSVVDTIDLKLERMQSSTANGRNVLLSMSHLGLSTPDGKRSLIDNLDLTVHEGEHLLIVGNSGAGKSSLLRAIAGLWTTGSGEIKRVPDDEVYFLPQRPYCSLGSLKDQLLYPSTESLNPEDYPDGHRLNRAHLLRRSMSDQDLLEVLDLVDLHDLPFRFGDGDPIKGLNAVVDWGNTLSLGEQQRLAFGRLVVNQPTLVILDEATSALDVVSEAKMYSLLRNMAQKELKRGHDNKVKLSRPGLTFISVGHRPTLLAYHDVKLRLNGGSDYVFEQIEKSALSIPTDMPAM